MKKFEAVNRSAPSRRLALNIADSYASEELLMRAGAIRAALRAEAIKSGQSSTEVARQALEFALGIKK